ncbi:MAG: class I SAM-dependent methyltransferase [Thermoplasmata archaeon]|nr:class I SAM-dependent methyltransferase [Thermoplasmata archaeon]
MRLRLRLDGIFHRPPRDRPVSTNVEGELFQLLGDSPEVRRAWSESHVIGLEQRISARLRGTLRFSRAPAPVAEPSGPWLEMLRLIYTVVRVRRPERVIETGVGPVGSSSAFILEAMRANGRGHLWSLDAGRYTALYGIEPGLGIPEELRSRHSLIIGESRKCLPQLLERCGPVEMFLHDSDHSHSNMRFEFDSVWPRLPPGGILLCDDANNDSLDRFSRSVNLEPAFLLYGSTPFGVLQKPATAGSLTVPLGS